MFQSISNWFWQSDSETHINKRKRTQRKKRIYKTVSYDVDLDKKSNIKIVENNSLKIKFQALQNCYENKYKELLNTPAFWEELHKIKDFDAGKSYHDIFTISMANVDTTTDVDKIVKRYPDVIETTYTLALKYCLIEKVGCVKDTDSDSDSDSDSGNSGEKRRDWIF